MARKQGGSIYVSTDPNATIDIGTPGVSTTIGRLGKLIFAGTAGTGSEILTEDAAFDLMTEDSLFLIHTET